MFILEKRTLLSPACLASLAILGLPMAVHAAQADADDVPAGKSKPVPAQSTATISPDPDGDDDDDEGDGQPVSVVIVAQRLDAARASIEPGLGAQVYSFSNALVELRPGGETVSLAQVLLQAPGVSQSPSGQLQVRGGNGLQYRINNVIIPEGFTDLAESLNARMEKRIDLITGVLPAQYGLEAGGVVNITTQSGAYQKGGQAELYGGGQGEIEPAFEYADSIGGTNLYTSGSVLYSRAGLSSLDGSARATHDTTRQADGFGYFEHPLDDQSSVSLILGGTDERFDIPHLSGDDRGGRERESGLYGIASYLRTSDRFSYQASLLLQDSGFSHDPDWNGDLLVDGLAQSVRDRRTTAGLQVEGSLKLSPAHTLRAGLLTTAAHQTSKVDSRVLPTDASGRPTSQTPFTLPLRATDTTRQTGVFAQDEWSLDSHMTLNGGLRYDTSAGASGTGAISPRLGLVWKAEAVTLHAGYARYLIPAPDDEAAGRTPRLFGTTGAPPGTGDTAARAEHDDYVDAGAQFASGHLTAGIDLYARRARNLIVHVPVGQTLLDRPLSFAEGRLSGVEVTANYADGPLTWWGNLALSRGRGRGIAAGQFAVTPEQLSYVQSHFVHLPQDQAMTASGGMSYRWDRLRLSGDVIYGSGMPRTLPGGAPDGGRLDGYAQVNVSAVYRIDGLSGKRLDLKLDVINLFDSRYALADGTAIGGEFPQWGARRGVFVGAEQSF